MVSAMRGVEDARLTTSLAAFVVNRRGKDEPGPGRFARPQSSQQIGALPTGRHGGGSRQSIAEIAGAGREAAAAPAAVAASGPPGPYRQRYFAASCPFTVA